MSGEGPGVSDDLQALEGRAKTADKTAKPVVIAGMGPAGLSAALEAAKKGLPVIIVENRDHFSRTQRLHADSRTFQFLDSLRDPNSKEDDHFFEHQCYRQKGKDGKPAMDGVVQVKDVQAFLERKLAAYPNVDIRRGKGFDITAIDPKDQVLTMKKPGSTEVEQIQFSHIIAADGGRRGITAKLNEAGQTAYQIHHTDLPMQHRQGEVGTAAIQLKAGENPPPNLPPEGSGSNFKIEHMAALNKLGWDQPYFPKVRVFRDEEGGKFFFSGEVPKTIQHMQDKESQRKALEQWAQLIVSIEMGIDPQKLELPKKATAPASDNPTQDEMKKYARSVEKDNLRATAFELQLSRADKPSVKLGQEGAFVLVGDAYKSANFFYGHGMNDAIADGRAAANNINPGTAPSFNFTGYEKHQQGHTKILDTRMRMDGETPTINLPGVFQRMEEQTKNLMKLADKMNSPEVKEALKDLKSAAQPGTADFDGQMFALQVENLGKEMNKFVQGKLDAHAKKGGGMLNMHGDGAKFSKMQSETKAAVDGVQKEIGGYYKFNNEQRQTWAAELAQESKSTAKASRK